MPHHHRSRRGRGRGPRHHSRSPPRFNHDFRERMRSRYPHIYDRLYNYGPSDINNDPEGHRGHQQPKLDRKPDPTKVLTVRKVDLCVQANIKKHHTDEYDICSPFNASPKLVVRRGQPFNIDIDFSKRYDPKTDDLRLVFQTGDKPLPSKGTHVEFILSDKDLPKQWGAKILSQEGNSIVVTIFTPPDCFVAKWKFKVDVVIKEDTAATVCRYVHKDEIYILFNPWCKDDDVYVEDPKDLAEYVMNESGKIYSGNQKSISAKPWNFGQFETVVLDTAMYLLDASDMNWAVRGKAVSVIRKISAMVNSSDDGGVLVGNWSGNYRGGRSPLSWTGSVAILESYWDSKRPVRFGQCWVFSGLCTTVCRTLGIPARSVTNFASAHDTDGSITIDIHLGPDGEADDELNSDSVWNFHVWNEAWMARPDLPAGYGGWQAFDATPQETSDDIYCCGPVSLRAIREGEVNMPYDAPFVFAEVNADRMYWMPDHIGDLKSVHTEKRAVGKFISTKAPGSKDRLDVTNLYKHEEGSALERAAVLRANHCASTRPDAYVCKEADVEFTLECDADETWVGEDFSLKLKMKNTGKKPRTVNGRVVVKSMLYTGVVLDRVFALPFQNSVVQPGKEEVISGRVKSCEYMPKLQERCMFDVGCMAKVKETDQVFTAKENFVLKKPNLTVKGPCEGKKDTEMKVEVSFKNPLDTTLTDCKIIVDGLATALTFPQGNVGGGCTFVATLPITPHKKGQKELIIIFASQQLEDINASHDVFIRA